MVKKKSATKIGAEQCYLALLAIEVAAKDQKIFKKSKDLKMWLAGRPLLENDAKNIGIKSARRIFRLLSEVNCFIKKENKKVVISDWGYKFLWAEEFKRFEIFKDCKASNDFGQKHPRYVGMMPCVIGKGFRFVKYRGKGTGSRRESTKYGWISEILRMEFGDNVKSASLAFMHADSEGDPHMHSKTREFFIFTSGSGFMELGDTEAIVAVNENWYAVIEPGTSHRVIPAGSRLNALVLSFPAWENTDDYKIGKAEYHRIEVYE